MTDVEQRVESAKCDLAVAELEHQQAELELARGTRFLDEAKEKYGKLKIAVELAKVKLRRERAWLSKVQTDATKGYISDSE